MSEHTLTDLTKDEALAASSFIRGLRLGVNINAETGDDGE